MCCLAKNASFSPHNGHCLLRHTTDMSGVSHSRRVCCITQQICLLCYAANIPAVSQSRRACCVTHLDTPDMSCLLRQGPNQGP